MPTFLRMMEILSCSMAGLLPYILLLVYPFRNHLRLKGYLAGFLTFLITAGVLYYDLLSSLGTAPAVLPFPQLRNAALIVLALVSINAPIWKNLLKLHQRQLLFLCVQIRILLSPSLPIRSIS